MIGTIGIVGGGQLGRMSAMAALQLGLQCHVFAPDAQCPASHAASAMTVAAFDDIAALHRFAQQIDVLTFEFENVSIPALKELEQFCSVRPALSVLGISQDRIAEKTFLNGIGVATAPWVALLSEADCAGDLLFPAIVKTTRLGYDGKGQQRVESPAQLRAAWAALQPKPLILEQVVDFAAECSVVVARNAAGDVVAFDTVENRHKHHILDTTYAPARLPEAVVARTQAVARQIAEALQLEGVLAVEMFIDQNGAVLVNELAPRPHNSGHWTLDACPASQFDLHIRAVAGLPLPGAVRHSDAVMRNLVGPDDMALVPDILRDPRLILHLYGKQHAEPGRKMGHVTHLFPRGALPGDHGIQAALGVLARYNDAP